MPKRENAQRVKVVVEFENTSPKPEEISGEMVEKMHEH